MLCFILKENNDLLLECTQFFVEFLKKIKLTNMLLGLRGQFD